MTRWMVAAAVAALFSGNAQAQSVTAGNPDGMLAAIKSAGYEATLTTDQVGDPMIETKVNGWNVSVLFYGCDETTRQGCDSVQLSTGFDRKTPIDPVRALEISRKLRFFAVQIDEEGDPYLRWDILTADGIPQSVFMSALRRYGETLDDAAEIIFEDEQ